MINPPFPGSDSEYQMEELGNGYRLTADAQKIHVAVSMNRDFVIDTTEVKASEFEGTVHPQFVPHMGGLVLVGYDATYKSTSNHPQQLSVKIQYQEIEHLTLPRTVTADMSLPQGRLEESFTFSNCQVKKK
jgi:hypothetical protein